MRSRLGLVVTVLALLLSALPASVALAEAPTTFSAYVFPTDVRLLEETNLGDSGRVLAKELVTGVVAYPTWDLLSNATVEIHATTNYVEYPTHEGEGVMQGTMVITPWDEYHAVAGTLELAFTANVSGLGGSAFRGHWTAVSQTGVFQGTNARGTFSFRPGEDLAPTLSGTWN